MSSFYGGVSASGGGATGGEQIAIIVDRVMNLNSSNPVANSTITKEFEKVEKLNNKVALIDGNSDNIENNYPSSGAVIRYVEDEVKKIDDAILIQSEQPESINNKLWIKSDNIQQVQVPSWDEFEDLIRIQDEKPNSENTKIWFTTPTTESTVKLPTWEDHTAAMRLIAQIQNQIGNISLAIQDGLLTITYDDEQ